MTDYTSATLRPFLAQVRASNLTASAKAEAGQLAADVVALCARVRTLEAELAKLQQQRVNETVNQPSSKKPEWDKRNGADPEKPRASASLAVAAPVPATGPRRIPSRIVPSITH